MHSKIGGIYFHGWKGKYIGASQIIMKTFHSRKSNASHCTKMFLIHQTAYKEDGHYHIIITNVACQLYFKVFL